MSSVVYRLIDPDNPIFRLVLAVFIGGVIGWDRQWRGKPAGLRTHMLVGLGAALMALIPMQISPSPSPDAISRVVQGVATGIGFLGAGEIFHQSVQGTAQPKIQGLTSSAAIWTTAALGLVTGCGLWVTSLIGLLLVWLILSLAPRLEQTASRHKHREDE